MYLDTLNNPLTPGSPQTLVGGAGVSIQIGNVVDLLGLGAGVATTGLYIGTAATWGTDFGIGAVKMQLQVVIGTAATTSTSATLDLYWQFAADNGSNQPSTWNTCAATGPIAVGSLTANKIIWRPDFPPSFPDNLEPRFMRLLAVVPAATNFTAGTILYAILVPARDDTAEKFAQKNYVTQNVA